MHFYKMLHIVAFKSSKSSKLLYILKKIRVSALFFCDNQHYATISTELNLY